MMSITHTVHAAWNVECQMYLFFNVLFKKIDMQHFKENDPVNLWDHVRGRRPGRR